MGLEKFKGKHIPILDWTFFTDEAAIEDYRESYSIDPAYSLLGTTITGDLLAMKNDCLVQIDHEDPNPENDFRLAKNIKQVLELIEASLQIPDFQDCEDVKQLKSIKKQIKACKKMAPKHLKDDFESAIDDIKDEIDLLRD